MGVSWEKMCGCGFEGIFMIQILQKSFKSIHDQAEIIFNHDFESNRPCNWIWSPASYDLPVCHELNQKALIESRNAFELFLISSDPIRSILITNRSRPITRWDLESGKNIFDQSKTFSLSLQRNTHHQPHNPNNNPILISHWDNNTH